MNISKRTKLIARRKEKRSIILKQLIPTILFLTAIAILILVYLCLFHPFVSSNSVDTKTGVCVSYDVKSYFGKSTTHSYILNFEDGTEFCIDSASSVKFDYYAFLESYERKEILVLKYRYDKIRTQNSVVELANADGNTFLSTKNVNLSILFFWMIICGLFIVFGGFYLYYQCLRKYHDNFSNEPW